MIIERLSKNYLAMHTNFLLVGIELINYESCSIPYITLPTELFGVSVKWATIRLINITNY